MELDAHYVAMPDHFDNVFWTVRHIASGDEVTPYNLPKGIARELAETLNVRFRAAKHGGSPFRDNLHAVLRIIDAAHMRAIINEEVTAEETYYLHTNLARASLGMKID